jgi:RING finger/CHY zinc finger protein 1
MSSVTSASNRRFGYSYSINVFLGVMISSCLIEACGLTPVILEKNHLAKVVKSFRVHGHMPFLRSRHCGLTLMRGGSGLLPVTANDSAPGGDANAINAQVVDDGGMQHLIVEGDSTSNDESSDACVDEEGLPMNSNFSGKLNSQFQNQRGCRHYSRGCRIRAPCCNQLFWCRHCHNEAMDNGEPKKAHQLDRFAVKLIQCANCTWEQRVQQRCERCGSLFGEYFCQICNFFDDDISKGVFHCDGCGICRVGGRENFFHCSACGCCYAIQLRSNHKCIVGAMHHNCPVCLENLFHSTSQVRVLRCGHTLHKKCLEQLLRRPTTVRSCPLCSKTIVDHRFTWQQVSTFLQQLCFIYCTDTI